MGRIIHIIYHEDWDGIVAAWVVVKQLTEPGRVFELHPINHGQRPPEIPSHRKIFILDFSFPPEIFDEFCLGRTGKVVMLDHHKTAIEKYLGWRKFEILNSINKPIKHEEDNITVIFENGAAGCLMAWSYFQEAYEPDFDRPYQIPPPLVLYAGDHDLYRFIQPDSKKVRAVMRSYPQTLKSCDELNERLEGGISLEMSAEGEAILRFMERQIESACKHAERMKICGHKCLGAQVPFEDLISEVAGRLSKDENIDFGLCWFKIAGNKWVYSLRSRGDFDVEEIASQFPGGGGHKNAAGFTCEINPVEFLSK